MSSQRKQKIRHAVIIDTEKCKGCSLCVACCPVKHLELSSVLNQRGVAYAQKKVNTSCIGCGNCFFMCPECCIEIKNIYVKESFKEKQKHR
jgi:2-oxoglutarate ferredoxin oxidoreductase subunit delta